MLSKRTIDEYLYCQTDYKPYLCGRKQSVTDSTFQTPTLFVYITN